MYIIKTNYSCLSTEKLSTIFFINILSPSSLINFITNLHKYSFNYWHGSI